MQRRSDYKGTWNALSVTAEDALRHITGNMADPSMIQSAVRTVGWLKETVGVRADDVILEIGCGAGRTGQVLAPIAATGLAPTLAEICLVTPKDDFRDSPMSISGYDVSGIADSSVDLVYCTVVFMHLFEWERFAYIREAHRLLRPGGRVFVDNFTICSDEGWEVFERHLAIPRTDRPAHIGMSSTPQELETYLARAGFTDIQSRIRHVWAQAFAAKTPTAAAG
jgi:SAM-dependent methyltransferase